MAVIDESWLAVWWPWLLVWGATAALLASSVAIVLRYRTYYRSPPRQDICIYLDARLVMDLYHRYGGKYAAALSRQVEKRVSTSRRFAGSANLDPLMVDAERGVTSEVFERYVVNDSPISIISIVLGVLDNAHDIVDVDLISQEVEASDALDKAFNRQPPTEHVRLQRIHTFLLIQGEFRVVDRTPEAVTLNAPFGEPDDPAQGPQVRIVCAAAGLRTNELFSGTFRCLGRVGTWDAATKTLEVRPTAVFH
ncbi:hypothetical protein [Pseudonocardia alaniniphila]|uniref:Uncharacterized protein n=1 Tax=Pseudonocardia alaniniphila TaxID=75291 RepID=A0ABS9TTI9_9PSEU|nr:hypothetical protein [Pseudonocardia alaniniphila]MCH6171885.1 hypothetical protein [Pseudonocardia alaniniphila]